MKNPNNLFESATGPVTIPMTNDYLFRALLQQNNNVLKGLLCSLLHMNEDQIRSVEITNPIILGEAIEEKDFFLDININLNNNSVVNLEMQVINEHNWPERSLSYLCRNYDNLNKGMKYEEVKPAIQIGLLDFTLFPEHPEFYATYQFLNVKNFTKYSDKLRLSVLNLSQIQLATEEDKTWRLDHWASLFKATTWEEIKMLARNDEYISEASETIFQLTQEERIRLQCQAREDYYLRQRSTQDKMAKLTSTNVELTATNAELTATNAELTATNAELTATNAELTATNAELTATNADLNATNAELNATIATLKAQMEANGIPANIPKK